MWLGGKSMPQEFVDYGRSWLEHHPDWTMVHWSDLDQLAEMRNAASVPLARNLAQLSDIVRYEVLHRFGGVYLDTDFLCQRNVESLLVGYDFVGAGEQENMLSAGFIAAVPGHPLVERAIELLPARIASDLHQAKSTGPGLLTEAWLSFKDAPSVKAYGPQLFYPYAWNEHHRRHEQFPDAYAIHHWAGSWL